MSKKRKHKRIRGEEEPAAEQPRGAQEQENGDYRPLTREELLKIAGGSGPKGHFFENFWEFMSVFVQVLLGFGVWVVVGSLLLFAIFKLFSQAIPGGGEEEAQLKQGQAAAKVETKEPVMTQGAQHPEQDEGEVSQEPYSTFQDEGEVPQESYSTYPDEVFVPEYDGGVVDEEMIPSADDIVTEEY